MTNGPDTTPIETLLAHGRRLKLRAPELSVAFGERAAALAEMAGSEELWAEAEGVAVYARARLGERACLVPRALTALRTAEAAGATQLALEMRTELALCARSVNAPMTGLAALRPALEHPELAGATRAAALAQLVGCLAHLGRRSVLDRALEEASSAIEADPVMPEEDKPTAQAMVCAAKAAHRRRHGDREAAMTAAREGLERLAQDGDADGAQVRIRLGLELVNALLDQAKTEAAAALADDLLSRPARAAASAPSAWLRMAIATRVLRPDARCEAAAVMLRDGLYVAQRHGHDALAASLWLELASIEEELGRPELALKAMQESRMAEFHHARRRGQALSLLTMAFGRCEQVVDPSEVLQTPAQGTEQSEVDSRHALDAAASRNGVPATSVLERLGITPGEGGRRRAPEPLDSPPEQRRHLHAVAENG